jgi:hypothetical protein
MQVLYERCAAVDVGKDVIAVAVRLPGKGPDARKWTIHVSASPSNGWSRCLEGFP